MVDGLTRSTLTPLRRSLWGVWLVTLLVGCGGQKMPDSSELGPVRGQAAEIRDGVAFVPGTQRRYSGPLVTYYWNGDYVRAYYRNGVQHGPWARYSKEHELLQQVCFEVGVPIACRD